MSNEQIPLGIEPLQAPRAAPPAQPPFPPGEWKQGRSWSQVLDPDNTVRVATMETWLPCARVVPATGKYQGTRGSDGSGGAVAVTSCGKRIYCSTAKSFIFLPPPVKKTYRVSR